MAIDYGFMLTLDLFGEAFIRFLEARSIVRGVLSVRRP